MKVIFKLSIAYPFHSHYKWFSTSVIYQWMISSFSLPNKWYPFTLNLVHVRRSLCILFCTIFVSCLPTTNNIPLHCHHIIYLITYLRSQILWFWFLLCNFLSLWLQMFMMNDEELKLEQQKPTMTLNLHIRIVYRLLLGAKWMLD